MRVSSPIKNTLDVPARLAINRSFAASLILDDACLSSSFVSIIRWQDAISLFQAKNRAGVSQTGSGTAIAGRRRQGGAEAKQSGREAADSVSWVKIDGHQRPWAASRLGQGIAPPRRLRSGGATAAPQAPNQRRRRPSGRAVIRTCRRCPCEAAPRCCVTVPCGDFRGSRLPSRSIFILAP